MGDDQPPAPAGRDLFLYRAFGLTPPGRYAEWVHDDVQTTSWLFRRGAQAAVGIFLAYSLLVLLLERSTSHFLGAAIGVSIGAVLQGTLFRNYVRRRALAHYRKRWAEEVHGLAPGPRSS